mgnify:CR=1 FL=1
MAESDRAATERAERERFTAFLDRMAAQPSHFKDWELRILGGFGGYQTQVPSTPIRTPERGVNESK